MRRPPQEAPQARPLLQVTRTTQSNRLARQLLSRMAVGRA